MSADTVVHFTSYMVVLPRLTTTGAPTWESRPVPGSTVVEPRKLCFWFAVCGMVRWCDGSAKEGRLQVLVVAREVFPYMVIIQSTQSVWSIPKIMIMLICSDTYQEAFQSVILRYIA
jgi:hypothetical protein